MESEADHSSSGQDPFRQHVHLIGDKGRWKQRDSESRREGCANARQTGAYVDDPPPAILFLERFNRAGPVATRRVKRDETNFLNRGS